MVSPRTSMEAVSRAIIDSGLMPSGISVLLEEADGESDNANVELPLLQLQPTDVDYVSIENTDFVGWTTDDNGNHTGRIFDSQYEMTIDIDVWTTPNDGFDPDTLGQQLRESLYPYSSYGPDKSFVDENGNPIEDITFFRLVSGEKTDDLLTTPTVRRWTHEVELWATERFFTDEDFVDTVDFPSADELSSDDTIIDDT